MKFDTPAKTNPIDREKVVGRPTPRIDGKFKTTGTAPYAYERHDVAPNQAHGYIVGASIAKGKIVALHTADAEASPGVITVVSTLDYKPVPLGPMNTANLFGGNKVQHYHQAIAMVVAETFEQARAAAHKICADYKREDGSFDLDKAASSAEPVDGSEKRQGDFETAFANAPVTLDARYTTPDESHAMMEPFATIAAWEGDKLTVWTSNQMIQWNKRDLATAMDMPMEKVRVDSPYIGGGFGAKLFLRADAVVAALGAKQAGRPVKLSMQRPLTFNNSTHRAATIQRIRMGAGEDGRLTAIAHESTSGNLPDGSPEEAINQTELLYAGENRLTEMRQAILDLPEGNAMRAPGGDIRPDGAGSRNGRDGRKAGHGPGRIPHRQ